jgi:predicted DNA-binding transcriptional regulator AlpA
VSHSQEHRGNQLLTPEDVAAMVCITVPTLWRWVATGLIPQPIRFTGKTARWRRCEIESHLRKMEQA